MQAILNKAFQLAQKYGHQFYCPEHLLRVLLDEHPVRVACYVFGVSPSEILARLDNWLDSLEKIPPHIKMDPEPSKLLDQMMESLYQTQLANIHLELDVAQFVKAISDLRESEAAYLLDHFFGNNLAGFIVAIAMQQSEDKDSGDPKDAGPDDESDDIENWDDFDDSDFSLGPNDDDDAFMDQNREDWRSLVVNVNAKVASHNKLIGRETELERTIEVLCRKEKNNPLHIGEPGVGKTALVYGLADLINRGLVPERLKNAVIYQLDLSTLLAGTQYRGQFEKRVKSIMEGLKKENNAIVYIDEIHNIVGAGASSEGSMDASNLLKPYLDGGEIRFIGSTTYEEYNRHIAQHHALVRRFQTIDVAEPTVEQTLEIVRGLQTNYERFHHVVYRPEAIEYAVKASAKYISDRFLPDKAIDLIDEAGAYLELHPNPRSVQYVTRGLIQTLLEKVCKVKAEALKSSGSVKLNSLQDRIAAQIFGQDEAVHQVVEAVEMAKAGLTDDNKPLASLLFVGPTGVGKTEVARVLAHELGVELVRFDMSEYTEKHTVAKLIGSPAGYVGYDDGGLLTDAIRKSPNCVLLLDEIEKAHSDIYNLLLQVMDYARLTDNKGQKADFRQVVLIMTSNAGAQFASQASVGFKSSVTRGDAMLQQVKRVFKPEFLNRLSATVVFHDMNREMARRILKKKIDQLKAKLRQRNVKLSLSQEAEAQLLKQGFSEEYGARELDRVIHHNVKTLLVHHMLYGKLVKGGTAVLDFQGGKFQLDVLGAAGRKKMARQL